MKAISLCFVLISLLLGLASCSPGGVTETGNPSQKKQLESDDPDDTGIPFGGLPNAIAPDSAQQLLTAICGKLTVCFGVADAACRSGIGPTDTLDTELGLASGFGTFDQVLNAAAAGTLTANETALGQCVSGIQTMNCAIPTLTGAYSTAQPGNYTNVYRMLQHLTGSCGAVYTSTTDSS